MPEEFIFYITMILITMISSSVVLTILYDKTKDENLCRMIVYERRLLIGFGIFIMLLHINGYRNGVYDLVNQQTVGCYTSEQDVICFNESADNLLEISKAGVTTRLVYEKINADQISFEYGGEKYIGTIKKENRQVQIVFKTSSGIETFVKSKEK
ncbi:hypothetical protein [Acetobacterium woodii]|uniref:Uncharacterized protein n=1 Tax=Acetobacterium woodii (strain ATCC 29683 / DSM 1030 / JCM 2381 / KCTC 1655 / WB1) TaxID=931626 RepID=H6LDD5_ACEWD|nr:hypothetical protein [Acetobacterium woodii]AFA47907.1 hypothetical protein Awo_c11230 [Acetobacterium woodii DSM 1030]